MSISENHRTDTLYLYISNLEKFDEYINGSDWEVPTLDWDFSCTSFIATTEEGNHIFGRNFDWKDSRPMVVRMDKSPGYDSLSVVDAGFFGIDSNFAIKLLPASILRHCIRMPMDGINEKGLVISGMVVNDMQMIDRPDIPNLYSVEFIRLALNYAATVNETIELWSQYDTVFPPGPPQHYLIADATGDSAVVEWYNNSMQVIRTDYPWQVATNHRLYVGENESTPACERFSGVNTTLTEQNGIISELEAFTMLETAAMEITQWSCVYNTETLTVKIKFKGNFEAKPVIYSL